ncbi:MAG: hypothetical protein ABIX01_13015 [Chitinophagaceae bacterium]
MPDLSPNSLVAAAANLTRLRAWVTDLYPLCLEYEEAVFKALGSTKENGNWTNFVANVFIDIAIGLASGAAIASGNPEVMPAIACLSAFLHDWGIGKDKPNTLDETFAVFEFGHQRMQTVIEQRLSSLVDPQSNYANLIAAWVKNIDFNGGTYTIGDLATKNFPGLGDAYNKLQTAALSSFKKSLWNLVVMKTCTYYENYHDYITIPKNEWITKYAQEIFYTRNKGNYLRARYVNTDANTNTFELIYWNLGIGGYAFPEVASNILFIDDTPGHIINPNGLFNRDYVFKQFSMQKYDFSKGHEIEDALGPDHDDYNFTGGMFPNLVKK